MDTNYRNIKTTFQIMDQIPEELIQAGGEILRSQIHKLINYTWNKEELPDQWKESIIVPIYRKGNKIDCGILLLLTYAKCYPIFSQDQVQM
jgi:hypothetical protein